MMVLAACGNDSSDSANTSGEDNNLNGEEMNNDENNSNASTEGFSSRLFAISLAVISTSSLKTSNIVVVLNVLSEQQLGGTKSVMVYGELTKEKESDVKRKRLEIGPFCKRVPISS